MIAIRAFLEVKESNQTNFRSSIRKAGVSLLQKIIITVPLILFGILAGIIVWVNVATENDESVEPIIEEYVSGKSAEEYINIAWNHWSEKGGYTDENYDKNLAFISIQSIEANEMAVLGVSKEFAQLKEAAEYLRGNVSGRLSDEEHAFFSDQFERSLEKIHTAIN